MEMLYYTQKNENETEDEKNRSKGLGQKGGKKGGQKPGKGDKKTKGDFDFVFDDEDDSAILKVLFTFYLLYYIQIIFIVINISFIWIIINVKLFYMYYLYMLQISNNYRYLKWSNL